MLTSPRQTDVRKSPFNKLEHNSAPDFFQSLQREATSAEPLCRHYIPSYTRALSHHLPDDRHRGTVGNHVSQPMSTQLLDKIKENFAYQNTAAVASNPLPRTPQPLWRVIHHRQKQQPAAPASINSTNPKCTTATHAFSRKRPDGMS